MRKYIKKSINKNAKKISLKNLWVVRQFKNEYNPIHWHGGHVSGAGFLKIPKDLILSIDLLYKSELSGSPSSTISLFRITSSIVV